MRFKVLLGPTVFLFYYIICRYFFNFHLVWSLEGFYFSNIHLIIKANLNKLWLWIFFFFLWRIHSNEVAQFVSNAQNEFSSVLHTCCDTVDQRSYNMGQSQWDVHSENMLLFIDTVFMFIQKHHNQKEMDRKKNICLFLIPLRSSPLVTPLWFSQLNIHFGLIFVYF